MIFMIIFTMEYIRLLGSSVDPILVAMTSYLMVPMVLGWIDVVNNVQPCRCSANGMRRRSDVVVLSGMDSSFP